MNNFGRALAVFSLGLVQSGRLAAAAPFGTDTSYPGLPPGAGKIRCENGRITAGTAALSMSWAMTPQGLKAESVRDEQAGRSLMLTGEVFQVLLASGQRYPASAMAPTENPRVKNPRVSELAPNPNAARLAARIPGRQVEVSLLSADGRLRVVWRTVIHDGANYLRQEADLTALQDDVVIKEMVWLDETIPGARTAGCVDGSPATADNFFFGSEDPHSLNSVNSPRQEIGAWSPQDLELGKKRQKSWPLAAAMLRAGANEFLFQYERGPHRLDIWRVALREDGQEVARDEHHGRTGTEHLDNVFSLSLARVKPGAQYELTAELGTDPALKLPVGQGVESLGKVHLVGGEGRVSCRLPRNAPLRQGETLTQSFVMGVAPPGQMRRAFLYYNSWYDTAWNPFALNETNCLEAIRLCGERFIKPHGVVVDGMVFDDGWDDPKTLWQFHAGFPSGFAPLAEACKEYNTRLGVWLSPFGGYGGSKDQRIKFGREQGYEINATGFSMAGPKYYAAFKQSCVGMIRKFGVNHFKFDGIATGMYASGGAQYVLDTAAMRRLMLELRQEDPNLYINLTTGSWPSPFWLRFADSICSKQQQWLTYRDQETYRNIVRKGPLYPLNSLMTQGVAYSKHGMAGDPTFNSAGFKDDVRAFFGSGTGLQELYIQPNKLTADDWRVLAEAAKWSRANADVLVDTHWIGGDPSKLEVYGYASWTPRKGIVMLRNPDEQPHQFALDVGTAFELPPGTPTKYALRSPWAEDSAKPLQAAQAGQPLKLTLQPFEVVICEVIAAN